jgi:hypothetical protein
MQRASVTILGALFYLGCGGAEPEVDTAAAPLTLAGVTHDTDDCWGGKTYLTLEADPEVPGRYQGESYGETSPIPGSPFRSSSRVEAERIGSVLHVSEVETLHADELPSWLRWCEAEFDLVWDEGPEGVALAGEWYSADCECVGDVELTVAEAWGD